MKPITDNKTYELIEKEIKGCFDFFWNESNGFNEESPGYGLTLDKTGSNICSIAAVGFALCSYIIGCERGYITFEEGYKRTLLTLKTLKRIEKKEGFFPHFVYQESGENHNSEFSTIDTAILLMGSITASSYFEGEIKELTTEIFDAVNWDFFIKDIDGKKQICMAYSEKYWPNNNGFCPATWDHYAEQLMIYLLYASKKNVDKELAIKLYEGFNRDKGIYNDLEVIHCYGNPLFIHQFTHCFFDFRKYLDRDGIDWFENSKNATLANRQYCQEQKWSKTYGIDSWGLSAFQGKNGYKVFGSPPFGYVNNPYQQELDGSVTPYASLSSINFTPVESIKALQYFNSIEGLNQKYGLTDSYNFENDYFVSNQYLGIDKGPTIIMLDNYLKETIWTYFMKSEYTLRAIKILEFKSKINKEEI